MNPVKARPQGHPTNVLDRQFQNREYRDVVISDLTYVRVGTRWNYICVLVGLFNREIIGYSAGEHKTAELEKEWNSDTKEAIAELNEDGTASCTFYEKTYPIE